MTTNTKDDDERKWRFVGTVAHLRDRPCRRLHPVTSLSVGDLVLVFVARIEKFFALDGNCGHMGEFNRVVYQRFFSFNISLPYFPSLQSLQRV